MKHLPPGSPICCNRAQRAAIAQTWGRRLLLSLLAGAAIAAVPPLQAQTGLYVDFSAARLNNPGGWIYGPTAGIYFDHGHLLFLSTGLDLRGSFLGGGGSTQLYSGLVGPRLAIRPHVVPIKPYVEAVIGAGRVDTNSASATQFEYQFLGGVDLTILPRIDWRTVEFSYGGLSGLNGSLHPKTISTGLVLRLP